MAFRVQAIIAIVRVPIAVIKHHYQKQCGAERVYLADTYCSSSREVRTGTEKGRNLEERDDADIGHKGLLLVSYYCSCLA